ncbi:hypothetical protein PSE_2956 [Pseudovibrio sp. FO-BEG1]|nr:hypothetical protein PSE_2956 [Pseudovibrio sp. FO-BEG1]
MLAKKHFHVQIKNVGSTVEGGSEAFALFAVSYKIFDIRRNAHVQIPRLKMVPGELTGAGC